MKKILIIMILALSATGASAAEEVKRGRQKPAVEAPVEKPAEKPEKPSERPAELPEERSKRRA